MNLLLLLIGILPSFAWLIFFLQEDPKPEPKRLIACAFLLGVLITPIVFGIQFFFSKVIGWLNLSSPNWRNQTVVLIVLALTEEALKFAAVYYGIRKSRFFDEPIDAMIYMVVAALGFAAAENVMVLFGLTNEGIAMAWGEIFRTTTLRFLGATLLHALSSGLVGYYWALGILKNNIRKFIGLGIILATLLHAVFNCLILSLDQKVIYATLFLIVIGVLVLNDFEGLKMYNKNNPT